MFDYIPFDIQLDIIKKLPVKSLIRFRSLSKQLKSFIENPEFIKNYHNNLTSPQHHLLVGNKLDTVQTYTCITDNNTFPQQKFLVTAPESLSLLTYPSILSSIDGLICFCGLYGDVDSETKVANKMAVIWNPAIRKSVGVVIIPKAGYKYNTIGFGVCPDTSDPKLVKISFDQHGMSSRWVVEVFTLSTRVWKTVYMGAPFIPFDLVHGPVFVNGVIYFHAYDHGLIYNYIVTFDLKSEKFGEVCIPGILQDTPYLVIAKVNESLGILEYHTDYFMRMIVCSVWTRKDDDNKTFSKIYTVKVGGNSFLTRVLEFRNNGEVVIQVNDDCYAEMDFHYYQPEYDFYEEEYDDEYDDEYEESRIEVYEPLSGHISSVGINGDKGRFSATSYMETLRLLDQSDSIIH